MHKVLIFIIFIISSCSLVEKNVQNRNNETIIRDQLSLKRDELKSCSAEDHTLKQIDFKIKIGTNKQVVYFSVNKGMTSKKLTDCLFKILDLMYFKNIESSKVINLNYLLTLK